MSRPMHLITILIAFGTFLVSSDAWSASNEKTVVERCKHKMTQQYDVDRFRHVWAEKTGHHRWKVQGKVNVRDHSYPFNCNVKDGSVRSWAYEGPSPHHRHKSDHDSNVGAAVAVGAGLALAAILVSNDHDHDRKADDTLRKNKTRLEDDCQESLQYRIRDEHESSARVHISEASLEGHDLKGEAKVRYEGHHPHHATYACHFGKKGRLLDVQYRLF